MSAGFNPIVTIQIICFSSIHILVWCFVYRTSSSYSAGSSDNRISELQLQQAEILDAASSFSESCSFLFSL